MSAGSPSHSLPPLSPLPPSSASSVASYAASSYTNSRAGQARILFPLQRCSLTAFTALKIFLIIMTNFLLLIGAGLFSKAVWAFEENAYMRIVGSSSDDTGGTGPGSYNVRGNVWHLDCCSRSSGGWSIFYAIFGWQNSATRKIP